jgi:hypothetical protein
MRQLRSVAAATALVLVAACDLNTAPNTPSVTDPTKDTYASALGVDIASMTKTASGLYYKDKVVGTGTAAVKGDSVQVNYTLWLTNGGELAQSCGEIAVAAGTTTVPRSAPYPLKKFDGWVVVRTDTERPFLLTTETV